MAFDVFVCPTINTHTHRSWEGECENTPTHRVEQSHMPGRRTGRAWWTCAFGRSILRYMDVWKDLQVRPSGLHTPSCLSSSCSHADQTVCGGFYCVTSFGLTTGERWIVFYLFNDKQEPQRCDKQRHETDTSSSFWSPAVCSGKQHLWNGVSFFQQNWSANVSVTLAPMGGQASPGSAEWSWHQDWNTPFSLLMNLHCRDDLWVLTGNGLRSPPNHQLGDAAPSHHSKFLRK